MQEEKGPQETGPLPLVSLEVENILRIHAVKLTMPPDGTLVIEGNNEQGKSSAVRSLEMLLAGADVLPPDPLHDDEQEGRIVATFGEYTVTRTFTRGRTPALRIASSSGKVKAPQTLLAGFLDFVSLNPLRFERMKAEEQLATVSRLIGFDPAVFDAEYSTAYNRRTEVGRVLGARQAELKALAVDQRAPAEEISISDLVAELSRRQAHNNDGAELSRKLDTALEGLKSQRNRLDAAAREVKRLERELQAAIDAQTACGASVQQAEEAARLAKAAVARFEPADSEETQTLLAAADGINRGVRSRKKAEALSAEAVSTSAEYDRLTEALAEIEQRKARARKEAAACLSIPGLEVADKNLVYNGKPLAQAGRSASLRVSVAVAMALNKDSRIKLLLIDDAEALDAGNKRAVLEQAHAAGYQVILAQVGNGNEPGAVVIEDGYVKAAK